MCGYSRSLIYYFEVKKCVNMDAISLIEWSEFTFTDACRSYLAIWGFVYVEGLHRCKVL
jgi:tRNA A37 threonylcarbamoyladenosine biosynthesis protein TsaE